MIKTKEFYKISGVTILVLCLGYGGRILAGEVSPAIGDQKRYQELLDENQKLKKLVQEMQKALVIERGERERFRIDTVNQLGRLGLPVSDENKSNAAISIDMEIQRLSLVLKNFQREQLEQKVEIERLRMGDSAALANRQTLQLIPLRDILGDLANTERDVRWKAVLRAGEIGKGSSELIAALNMLLSDNDALVRLLTVETLIKIRAHPDRDLFRLVWGCFLNDAETRGVSAKIISRLGKDHNDMVARLVDCLKDNDEDVVWHAILGLRDVGPNAGAALPSLRVASNDTRPKIRKAATETLALLEKLATEVGK